jgi:hypothetical protein
VAMQLKHSKFFDILQFLLVPCQHARELDQR